jgi:hypothetical protein
MLYSIYVEGERAQGLLTSVGHQHTVPYKLQTQYRHTPNQPRKTPVFLKFSASKSYRSYFIQVRARFHIWYIGAR